MERGGDDREGNEREGKRGEGMGKELFENERAKSLFISFSKLQFEKLFSKLVREDKRLVSADGN